MPYCQKSASIERLFVSGFFRFLARLPRNLSLFEQPGLNSNRIHMRFTQILTLGAIENLPFPSRNQQAG